MLNERMKILIVGDGAVASALVREFSQYDYVEKIYATSGISDLFETVCSNINQAQLEAIKNTVVKAVEVGCFYEQS